MEYQNIITEENRSRKIIKSGKKIRKKFIRPESKGRKFLDLKFEALNPEEYYKGNTTIAKEAR